MSNFKNSDLLLVCRHFKWAPNLCHPVSTTPLMATPDCSIRRRHERWLATWYRKGGTEAQLEVAPLKAVAAHTEEENEDDSRCSSSGGRDSSGVYLEEEMET